MWQTIVGFVGGPVIKGLLDAYNAKLKAGNTSEKIAADLAADEIAAQTTEAQAQSQLKIAEVGHSFEPEKIAFYIVAFYMGKAMIWDAALHLGTTDAVHGDVGAWAGLVVAFYFGKRGFENVARIVRR